MAEARDGATGREGPATNGVREVIPERFRERYLRWKAEYLSTAAGRENWGRYASGGDFLLTITVAEERGQDAEVSGYSWDAGGRLVAATITLGSQLDKGFPGPDCYPVISALARGRRAARVSGSVLAATKLAHEFGHVSRTAATDAGHFQLQNRLIPVYNQILAANGRNTDDPRLIELARQMGGTPSEIGRDRELWAEVSALAYLREKYAGGETQRPVFRAIRRAVEEYAGEHAERFR